MSAVMKKKIISLVMVVAMVVSLFTNYTPAVEVSAAEVATGTFELVTSVSDLTDGQYVIASQYNKTTAQDNYGALGTTIKSGFADSINVSVEGTKIVNPDSSAIWNVTVNGNNITISNGEQYIAATETSNQLAYVSDATEYAVEENANGGYYFDLLRTVGTDQYMICRFVSTSGSNFKSYKASYSNKKAHHGVQLYKLVESATPDPTATEAPVVTEEPSVTPEPTATEAPVVTEEPSVTPEPTATEAPVVTEEPSVTPEPTATEAPVVTEAPSATPEPTATEAPAETTPVVADGEYVIYNVGSGMALSVNATESSAYYRAGVAYEMTDGKLSNVAETEIWTVTNNEDGTVTISNGDNSLSKGPGSGNLLIGTELASGAITTWTIIANENGTFYIANTDSTGKYGLYYAEWYAKYTEFTTYSTSTDKLSSIFEMTLIPKGSVVYSESEVTPVPTVTEAPTATPEPTVTEAPTTTPEPTATEAPTATPEPTVTEAPTEAPEPTTAPAALGKSDGIANGDKVVIYNPSNKKVLSATVSGKKLAGTDAAVEDGILTISGDAAFVNVSVDANGYYTFTSEDGKYLTSGATGNSLSFADEASDYSLWTVEKNDASGSYVIVNVNAVYNKNGTDVKQALEYYSGFTTYSYTSAGAAYLVDFYKEVEMVTVYSSVELADGTEFVIYYPEGKVFMTETASGKKLAGTEATAVKDYLTVTGETAPVVLTASLDAATGYYTFTAADGKYLTSGATGNSLSFTDEASNYSLWTVEKDATSGNFVVMNVNASYTKNETTYKQALEYYSGFTTYNYTSATKYYQFNFYAASVVPATALEETTTPDAPTGESSKVVIADGKYFIYNPANGYALSATANGNYRAGSAYTLNASGSFDEAAAEDVWTIKNNADGTVTITSADGGKLSMAASYSSTPFDEVNDTWTITAQEDGTYLIKNVGRNSYLEWYADKSYFSCYYNITDDTAKNFAMTFIPADKVSVNSLADGQYCIYSATAAGVMAYVGAGTVVAAEADESGKVKFTGSNVGAAVYTITKEAAGTYLIKCGDKFLTGTSNRTLELTDEAESSTTRDSHWTITYDTVLGAYTITTTTAVKYSSTLGYAAPLYFEYYSSNGFCLYYPPTAGNDNSIYGFSFLDASEVESKNGYVGGDIPVASELPVSGKKYVIYNPYSSTVMGSLIEGVDGSSPSLGCVDATLTDGVISVKNGGLIFNIEPVGKDNAGHTLYTIENNGQYLVTSDDEELGFSSTVTEYTKWYFTEVVGGYIIYNNKAAYSSSPVCIEYFSGAYSGWTYKGSTLFTFNFYEVEDSFGTGFVVSPEVNFAEMNHANLEVDFPVEFTLDDLGDIQTVNAEVTFYSGETKVGTKTYAAVMDGYNGTFTVPAVDFANADSMKFEVSVTSSVNGYTLNYKGTAGTAIDDLPYIKSVSPAANAQTGSDLNPVIEIVTANIGSNATAVLTLNGETVAVSQSGKTFSYKAAGDMKSGKYVAVVTITRADGKTATKTWSFYVGKQGVSAYFGQIHTHTAEYSDGSGTLEQAYEHAAGVKDLDYIIVTDHSNYFDTTATATMDSIYDAAAPSLLLSSTVVDGVTLTKWQEAKLTASQYTTDKFIAAYGYEMTWSGGPGHSNVFNSLGIVSRNNTTLNDKSNNAGMLAFYDLLVAAQKANATSTGSGSISAMFNHPGTTFGYFDSFTGLTADRDAILNLIEVGNGEGAVGGTAYFPSYEYYDMALQVGWHIAPTNNQDNHKGNWGDSNTTRTVVLTDNFTEQGLYDAMTNKAVYSTEDQNLTIYYYLDDVLQGGTVENAGETVHFEVSLSDKDNEKLGYVYVIGDAGSILYTSENITGNTAELDFELKNTSAYYYIKVVQADGDIAVTAPVWVGDVNDSKAAVQLSVATASETPVQNNVEKLTVSAQNNEDAAIKVVSYSIAVDGKVVSENLSVDSSVAAGSAYTVSYDWTPAEYGTHAILVSMIIMVNGEAQTITASKNIYVKGADYNKISNISEAKKITEAQSGVEFTLEGIVTANTSGYDKETAFFDCTYIQDATGGINIFPVSDSLQAGTKVRVHGAITYYCGEIELNLSEDYGGYIEVIDSNINEVAPVSVSCAEAMSDENIGLLMSITGTVTEIHEAEGIIDRIYVNDGTTTACIYINGYILNSATHTSGFGADGAAAIAVGAKITAVGVGSRDTDDSAADGILRRLRVRNRMEITVVEEAPVVTPAPVLTPSPLEIIVAPTATPTPVEEPTPTPSAEEIVDIDTPDTPQGDVADEKVEIPTIELTGEQEIVSGKGKNGHFYDAEGEMITSSLVRTAKGYLTYVDEDGNKLSETIISVTSVDENGEEVTDLYYVKANGYIARNRRVTLEDGTYRYAGKDGKLMTDGFFETKKGYLCYADENGVLAVGLFTVGEDKYYANKAGHVQTSDWVLVDNKVYYTSKTGKITKSATLDD